VSGATSLPVVFGNTITNNDIGIRLSSNSSGFCRGNTISGNTSYGANNLTATVIVDAEYNYWNDNTGPYDPLDDTSSGGWFNPSGLGDEVSNKVDYDPWVGVSYDVDGDGIPDLWETDNFLNTTTVDETTDNDSDGLLDIHEFAYGTDPKAQDTDADGMPDGYEKDYKFNPTADDAREDADEDSYSNLREYISGTDARDDQDIPPIIADDDADNDVDGYNLAMLLAEFGRDDCDIVTCNYDLDSDGIVGEIDLFLFSEDYGRID